MLYLKIINKPEPEEISWSMSATHVLQSKIERISNLPTLPQLASHLMKTLNDPHASASQIAALVSQDISLSAKILRLANSAFYGIPRTITNISNAVIVLGFKVINTLVVSLSVFDMFPNESHSTGFNRKTLWKHCVQCGMLAKLLSAQAPKSMTDPEDAFCAGLLHDIGKVVMEQYLHDDFTSAHRYAEKTKKSFIEAEREQLTFTHTDVARWLMAQWDLPENLLSAIINHHTPTSAGQYSGSVFLCHYADYLTYSNEINGRNGIAPPPLDESTLDSLGLNENQVSAVVARFPEEFAKTASFYDIL
jgi:putative nucleotidyltransferase with HDIG domain